MGSLTSKQSSSNTVTTRNHTSEETSFQNFTNSLRRSLRIKNHSTNASDEPRHQSQLSPSDLSKTPAPVRSKLPESSEQPTTISTSSLATPEKVNVSYSSKVASAPAPESPKVKISPEEVGKAMNVLKGAIEAKANETEEIDEKNKGTVNEGLQQVSTFKGDAITNGNRVENVVDKKLDEAGGKAQTKVNEGRLEVESILSRLTPADKSGEQSPEVEVAPKPATASLLAALEKRKERMDEMKKRDSSPPPGVSNVLEKETEAHSEVVEVGPKVDISKEEVSKARNILKGAIEAKGKETEEMANKKSYEVGEKIQGKSEN
nr:expressed conserved protein [Hymenolepis microstoma]